MNNGYLSPVVEELIAEHVADGKDARDLARALLESGLCAKYREAMNIATTELPHAYSIARDQGMSPSFDDTIAEAMLRGKGEAHLVGVLLDRGFFTDRNEARKIAQYEMLSRHSKRIDEAIQQSLAVDRKEWVYIDSRKNDSAHCRNHAHINGQCVPKDKPFTLVGLDGNTYYPMHPHDPVLPPEERMGCLCMHRGIVSDSAFGLSYEERRALYQKYREEDDGAWEAELDAKNRAKAGIESRIAKPAKKRQTSLDVDNE